MAEPRSSTVASSELVKCVRLDQMRTVEEHRGCPYCYGKAAEVAAGDRARFCDYQAGQDPLHFGFPEGTSRDNG